MFETPETLTLNQLLDPVSRCLTPEVARRLVELRAAPEPVGRYAVFRAAKAGDPDAMAIVVEAGRYLGRAIANVLSVLDLRLVVLSGDVARDFPAFVDAVRAAVEVHAFRIDRTSVEVVASPFGADMRVKGSLALALHDLLYAPTLTLQAALPDEAAGWPRLSASHVAG